MHRSTNILIFLLFLIPLCLFLAVRFFDFKEPSPNFCEIPIADISSLNGEWRYYPDEGSHCVSLRLPISPNNMSSYYPDEYRVSGNYRLRIKNGIMQSYMFFPMLKKRHVPDMSNGIPIIDESEYFYFSPLKISDKNQISVIEDFGGIIWGMSPAGIGQRGLNYLAFFTKALDTNPIIMLVGRNPQTQKRRYDVITFFDELGSVDPTVVEVLALAAEGLDSLPKEIAKCKNLKKLFLPYNKLKFGEADIKILKSFKHLEVLDIRFNDIFDADGNALSFLKDLASLKKIYIGGAIREYGKDFEGMKPEFGRGSRRVVPKVFAHMPNLQLLSISNEASVIFPPDYNTAMSPKEILLISSSTGNFIGEQLREKIKSVDPLTQ